MSINIWSIHDYLLFKRVGPLTKFLSNKAAPPFDLSVGINPTFNESSRQLPNTE
jgi:hypothetical protein